MKNYIENLEQKLNDKNDEIFALKTRCEMNFPKIMHEMEEKIKYLSIENERLNTILIERCVDMR